jgi:hypothetical protein
VAQDILKWKAVYKFLVYVVKSNLTTSGNFFKGNKKNAIAVHANSSYLIPKRLPKAIFHMFFFLTFLMRISLLSVNNDQIIYKNMLVFCNSFRKQIRYTI